MRRLFAFLAVFTTGCATVINGRYQPVEVSSSPPGARVIVDCGDVPSDQGVTPVRVTLRRGARDCHLELTMDGHDPARVQFRRDVSRQVWANALPAFGVGLAAGIAYALANLFDGGDGDQANTAFVAGIVVTGAASYLIDRSSGAMYRQQPERVEVTLNATR